MKESGVALQTFYRHFAGKDQLLLAVIEDVITESCAAFARAAQDLPDPVARLRFYVTSAIRAVRLDGDVATGPRFITAEHWRLHRMFPDELAEATRPFTDLVRREIEDAVAAGLLAPADADRDAWFVTHLVMTTFHHYAFAPATEPVEAIADSLWAFCLAGLGGRSPS